MVVKTMTFSDPFAHSLPLFFNLQILKLDDIYHLYVSSFVYECHNNLAPNHFSDHFVQLTDIHHYKTRSVSHGDFFLKRKDSIPYALSVLMKQRYEITSLLISETLHQLETSRKRSNNCFWGLIAQKFDYTYFILCGCFCSELGANVLWALCLLAAC